jgi:hypothetical protein
MMSPWKSHNHSSLQPVLLFHLGNIFLKQCECVGQSFLSQAAPFMINVLM